MKRKALLKRLCAGALSAAFVLSGTTITASAAGRTPDGMIDEVYDYKFLKPGLVDDDGINDSVRDAQIVRMAANAVMNLEESIDLREYDLQKEDALAISTIVREVYPELFFIDSLTVNYNPITNIANKMTPGYQDTDSEGHPDAAAIQARLQSFYAEADRYLALASDQLNYCKDDFSKAVVLHDEIAQDAYYDLGNRKNDVFMSEKHGVCVNYSQIYAYLLGQLGIHTELITTPEDEMNHEWLRVRLDGQYYNVDPTWADPTAGENKEYPGFVEHTYFLLSDDKIASLEKPHYGYKYIYPADSTLYDNAAFHNYNSRFCKTDKNSTVFYAINNVTKKLVSYDYATGTETELYDLSEYKWKSNSSGSTYRKGFSNLAEYNGYLFLNSEKKIYRYDPATGNMAFMFSADDDKQYFGVRIKDGYVMAYTGEYDPCDAKPVAVAYASRAATPAQSLTISGKVTEMKIGESAQLSVKLSPEDSLDGISMDSSDHSVAVLEQSGSNVRLVAKSEGTAMIFAMAASGAYDSFVVTVKSDKVKLTGVSIDNSSPVVGVGRTLQLGAVIQPADADYSEMNWTSSDESIVTVDETGLITGIKSGYATVGVQVDSFYTYVVVHVEDVAAESIKMSKTAVSLKKGSKTELSATISPADTTKKNVSWSTSSSSVAKIEIKDNRVYVVGVSKGTATITATTANGKTATCKVTVTDDTVAVTNVKLSKTSLSLNKGKTSTLKATITPTNATNKELTWSTSNKKVATVDSKGKVKAVGKGTATITVKSSNGKKATCKVTVKIPATKVKLSKTKLTITAGKTATLKATMTPSGSTDKLTWTTSNKNIATVKNGKVTAKKAGTVTITVKTSSGKKATCKVTVKKAVSVTKKASVKTAAGTFAITLKDKTATIEIFGTKTTLNSGNKANFKINGKAVEVTNSGTNVTLVEKVNGKKVTHKAF